MTLSKTVLACMIIGHTILLKAVGGCGCGDVPQFSHVDGIAAYTNAVVAVDERTGGGRTFRTLYRLCRENADSVWETKFGIRCEITEGEPFGGWRTVRAPVSDGGDPFSDITPSDTIVVHIGSSRFAKVGYTEERTDGGAVTTTTLYRGNRRTYRNDSFGGFFWNCDGVVGMADAGVVAFYDWPCRTPRRVAKTERAILGFSRTSLWVARMTERRNGETVSDRWIISYRPAPSPGEIRDELNAMADEVREDRVRRRGDGGSSRLIRDGTDSTD